MVCCLFFRMLKAETHSTSSIVANRMVRIQLMKFGRVNLSNNLSMKYNHAVHENSSFWVTTGNCCKICECRCDLVLH